MSTIANVYANLLSVSLLICASLATAGPPHSPQTPSPFALDQDAELVCSGVQSRLAPASRVFSEPGSPASEPDVQRNLRNNARLIETELFPVRLDPSVGAADSAYVHELLDGLLPSMQAILGPPIGLDTLTLEFSNETAGYFSGIALLHIPGPQNHRGVDNDRDGRVDEDPHDGRDNDADGRIDEDWIYHRSWDNLFIHELTHAWLDGILPPSPSWLDEGMAEASRHFVSEHASRQQRDRNFQWRNFARRMMVVDLENVEAEQIMGGPGRIWDRADNGLTYRAAGQSVILACYAQLMAGQDSPHPLEHLARELRDDTASDTFRSPLPEVISRAWNTPIDGIAPSGRWLGARSVAATWVRNGTFLHLGPAPGTTALNPEQMRVRYFTRRYGMFDYLRGTNPLTYTNADGFRVAGVAGSSLPPALPPGAYLVEAEEEHEGSTVYGRSWIMVTPSGEQILDSGQGIAVIFVGNDGRPVEVPNFEVNGRIVETVPGGAIVAPVSALSPDGMLVFRSEGQLLGTVTVPGPMSRVVPLFLNGPQFSEVVSWRPYRPSAGDTLQLTVRLSRTGLSQTPSSILARLTGWQSGWESREELRPTSNPDVWSARIPVLERADVGVINLQNADSQHGSNHMSYWAIACEIRETKELALVTIDTDAHRVTATFDSPVLPNSYSLQWAATSSGPWLASTTTAVSDPERPEVVTWNIHRDSGQFRYGRIVRTSDVTESPVCRFLIGADAPYSRIATGPPFPNPTRDGIRVALDLDLAATLEMEIYDPAGRRVYGPVKHVLAPGHRELQWNGQFAGRDAHSGTYFLRLRGPSLDISRRFVLLRDRPW